MPSAGVNKTIEHPTFKNMVFAAIRADKSKKGISRQAILKYIMANYSVGQDAKTVNRRVKPILKKMMQSGEMQVLSGTGCSGRYKVEKHISKEPAKPAAKKAKKTASPKKKINKEQRKKVAKQSVKRKPVKKSKSPSKKIIKVVKKPVANKAKINEII
ncbi:hypothetical protein GJ496_010759 [Pomphorhynchus laevis]|nr:hypothetical protein GJ496_010759 [Pomphorhynchus laevis]